MSDLISRSELIKELNKYCGNQRYLVSENIREIINNQPTTYDVEKVVGELEQKKEEVQRMRNTCVALSDLEVCDIENVIYERAIEIVKQGGVSDDVCEWNGQSRLVTYTNFTTACGYSFDLETNNELLKAFRYCPFCGKKIKVVE